MSHLLDNPVWHALIGPHAGLAVGRGFARQYPREVTPFAAIAEPSSVAYEHLPADLPYGTEARLFRPSAEAAPKGWAVLSARPILQMVLNPAVRPQPRHADEIVTLGQSDVPDMLALAGATKPGPFDKRTYELGRYVGIRDHGRLVAMAGERFRLAGFVELSAICVSPEVRRSGLGSAMVLHLAELCLSQNATPFLHVFPDNPAAELYRHLGFRERRQLWVIWQRPVADRSHKSTREAAIPRMACRRNRLHGRHFHMGDRILRPLGVPGAAAS